MVTAPDVEPELICGNGRRVLVGLVDLVHSVLAAGHRVRVDDGEVRVDPPLAPDVLELLTDQPSDVEAVLGGVAVR